MFFWRLEQLKEELVSRPLSAREELPYLVGGVVLSTAGLYIPYIGGDVPLPLEAAAAIAIAVAGTIYVYLQNGGADAPLFLQRYFAIGWVVAMRFAAVLAVMFAAYIGGLEITGRDMPEHTPWYETIIQWLWQIGLYYRIGFHMSDVAQRAKAV